MEIGCDNKLFIKEEIGYDNNIFIKEEWLDDYIGACEEVVVAEEEVEEEVVVEEGTLNQAPIKVAEALDHSYSLRKVGFKDEPLHNNEGFCGTRRAREATEDHWSEETLTADEEVEEIDDGWDDFIHTSDGNGREHDTIIKYEQYLKRHIGDRAVVQKIPTYRRTSGTKNDDASMCMQGQWSEAANEWNTGVTEELDGICSTHDEKIIEQQPKLSDKEDYCISEDSDDSCTPSKRAYRRKKAGSYICKACGYECKNPNMLKSHMISSATCKNPYACNLCIKRFTSGSYLKKHLLTHIWTKKYPCGMCDYASTTSYGLMEHMLTHHSIMQYICNVCCYTATSSDRLNEHIKLVHAGEKPHECYICNKGYRKNGHLRAHLRLHELGRIRGKKRHVSKKRVGKS